MSDPRPPPESNASAQGDPEREELREMNDALLVSLVRQHELAEQAQQAEAALRESEQRYRTVLDQVKEYAIFSIDPEGRATTWNEGVKKTLGFDEREFIGKDITRAIFTPEDIQAGVPERELEHARSEGAASGDRWMRRKDGTRFFAGGSTMSQKDASGTLIGFTKVMRDHTDRKLLEDAREESEIRYRRLFESAQHGILILDAHTGKIIEANSYMAGLLRMEDKDLIGRQLHELGILKDAGEEAAALGEVHQGGYISRLSTLRVGDKDVDIELTGNAYREGHRLLVQCIVNDISVRVAMEKTIQAQAMVLVTESRRKDDFLAMLSHELRNPLAPIRSAIHLLKSYAQGGEDSIQKQAREIIERQVGNLTRIVSDLLEVSRVISGRIRLDMQVVDLNKVMAHAIQTVRPLIEQRRHELDVAHSEQPLWVHADAIRMEQVFINLLDNAVKYTPDGGRLTVSCGHPEAGGLSAQVRVRDTGSGIPRELVEGRRIFDLFTQAERSLDRAAGGLGIGLSLVHRLIELHGGTVEVESPPAGSDVGSEFIVKLPLVRAPPAPRALAGTGEPASPAQGVRILMVEDNIDLVAMVENTLRHRGYSVRSAYTGPEGLSIAREWQPDVVLLDIGLPGLDGYSIARRLRADTEHFGKGGFQGRLIALTGYSRDADITNAREAGFDAHLPKPYDVDDLENAMMSGHLWR